ncbi:MAG: endonuclease/exonuclease/phosphatase family protein, partial [Egibacteraceae bacterium]
EGVAHAIAAAQPDVVGLQEVDVAWSARSDFVDQAQTLAERLGMEAFFAPIYSLDPLEPGQSRREYGLAILSRHPITEATNHELTRHPTVDPDPTIRPLPGFPEIRTVVRGARLRVFNTHLDYRADPTIRRQQVAETIDLLEAAPAGEPVLLLGDLNATPDAPELAPLFDRLLDGWAQAGAGDGLTFPAGQPVKRIDYVLTDPRVQATHAEVLDTGASDHRAVVADLLVPRRP